MNEETFFFLSSNEKKQRPDGDERKKNSSDSLKARAVEHIFQFRARKLMNGFGWFIFSALLKKGKNVKTIERTQNDHFLGKKTTFFLKYKMLFEKKMDYLAL